ncbi:KR domain-containing protein, partial [Streptomyces sp. NPDC047525]|uniref:KR domain-containing protein n=1 Tax=Streptomyces sp. NPDC047525 TaxID=3155264 RepID=UPI0033DEF40C
DTTNHHTLKQTLHTIPHHHPLTAVIHTAGIAGEAKPLVELELNELEAVLAAKAVGAWNLHDLLRDVPLELFLMFSSVSGVWGSAGQGGYAAANAYLDALAEHRRAEGLPGTSIAWGAWAGDGMAGDDEYVAWLNRSGMRTMAPARAMAALQSVVDRDETCVTVSDMDWARFADAFNAARHRTLLDRLEYTTEADGTAGAADSDSVGPLAARIASAAPAQRTYVLLEALGAEVAAVLGHARAVELEEDLSFLKIGFDSLMGVELKGKLATATGLDLPATLIYDFPTPAELVAHLLERLAGSADADPSDGLLTPLRELERALEFTPNDDALREEVTGRLETLLWRWQELTTGGTGTSPEPGGEDLQEDLEAVTDDEIFDLLDREFGDS